VTEPLLHGTQIDANPQTPRSKRRTELIELRSRGHKRDTKPAPTPAAEIVRKETADFTARYANYTHLESSLWDVKIYFGQTDQAAGNNVVPVNATITLPWAQIKVLAYFLQIDLAGYEAENGRIKIPNGIIPAPDVPVFLEFYEKFIDANPEAARTQESK
jgi:hypothetical protein